MLVLFCSTLIIPLEPTLWCSNLIEKVTKLVKDVWLRHIVWSKKKKKKVNHCARQEYNVLTYSECGEPPSPSPLPLPVFPQELLQTRISPQNLSTFQLSAFLLHFCKISRPYLVAVQDYWAGLFLVKYL